MHREEKLSSHATRDTHGLGQPAKDAEAAICGEHDGVDARCVRVLLPRQQPSDSQAGQPSWHLQRRGGVAKGNARGYVICTYRGEGVSQDKPVNLHQTNKYPSKVLIDIVHVTLLF